MWRVATKDGKAMARLAQRRVRRDLGVKLSFGARQSLSYACPHGSFTDCYLYAGRGREVIKRKFL